MVPAPEEERALIARLFLERVFPEVPRLLVDDSGEWKSVWMGLKNERKQRLRDQIERMGVSLTGLKSRAEWITKRDAVLWERAHEESGPESGSTSSAP